MSSEAKAGHQMSSEMSQNLTVSTVLDPLGQVRRGKFARVDGSWAEFQFGEFVEQPLIGDFLVLGLPVEFHCHGVETHDFSDFSLRDLSWINTYMHRHGRRCVLAGYLRKGELPRFKSFMETYAAEQTQGHLANIAGVALEGPLLSSVGGTPPFTQWMPSKAEWRVIADCSRLGLKYIVLSPDAQTGSDSAGSTTFDPPSVDWIVELLLDSGITPALGHFAENDPDRSAKCVKRVVAIAERQALHWSGAPIITDHLFNDTPLSFRHAWRTKEERAHRNADLRRLEIESWNFDNLRTRLGLVPAALIAAARSGVVNLCLNFDGDHVDLEICRRIVELVGPKSIIAMTDLSASHIAGYQLSMHEDSSLWFRSERDGEVVAAGSQDIDTQITNMRRIGLDEKAIWEMTTFLPSRVIGDVLESLQVPPRGCSYVSPTMERYPVYQYP